jgi:hypothetical protein
LKNHSKARCKTVHSEGVKLGKSLKTWQQNGTKRVKLGKSLKKSQQNGTVSEKSLKKSQQKRRSKTLKITKRIGSKTRL